MHDLLGQNKTNHQISIKRSPSVLKLSPDDNVSEVDVEVKLYPFLYNLLFTTTVTRNMIKVFGCSEKFTPKQQILQ